jgi:hypothetical protein
MCVTPRGRFDLSLHEGGVVLHTAKDALRIPKEACKEILSLAKPDLYSKDQSKVRRVAAPPPRGSPPHPSLPPRARRCATSCCSCS